MMYIVDISDIGIYTLFHNESNSVYYGTKSEVQKMIDRTGEYIKNPDYIEDKDNYKKMFLASIYNNELCKVVMKTGRVRYIEIQKIMKYAQDNKLINCKIIDGKLTHSDVLLYNMGDIRQQIADKYKRFIAKSKLIGVDNSFQYSIEGDNIILEKFTGTSSRVNIPEFITAIGEQAFKGCDVTKVIIPESVKFIGGRAFADTKIRDIYIPDTVKYIGCGVFADMKFPLRSNIEILNEYEQYPLAYYYEKECYVSEETYEYFTKHK